MLPTRPRMTSRIGLPAAALVLLLATPAPAQEGAKIVGRWSFDEGQGSEAGDGSDGATNGRIVKASWAEGRAGKALSFDDYSLKNYLRPDVKEATRVVIPHHDRLNPGGPFTLKASIYPTRDPLYYGGIVEKGTGYGSSFRLLIIRGRKIRAVYGAGKTQITSSQPVELNAWHDLELSYDGSRLTLKVDGKEAGQATQVKAEAGSDADVVIGERFSGRIDEVVLSRR